MLDLIFTSLFKYKLVIHLSFNFSKKFINFFCLNHTFFQLKMLGESSSSGHLD